MIIEVALYLIAYAISRCLFNVPRAGLTWSAIFYVVYSVCFLIGPMFILVGYWLKIYDDINVNALSMIVGASALGLIFFGLGGLAARTWKRRRKVLIEPESSSKIKIFSYACIAASLLGTSTFVAANGVVILQEGGYENRYLSNQGLGFATVLMPLFVYGVCALTLTLWKTKLLRASALSVMLGIVVYAVMGGDRQVLVAGIAAVAAVALKDRRISSFYYVTAVGAVLLLSFGLAVLRYWDARLDGSGLEVFYHYSVDSFAPVRSVVKILDWAKYGSRYDATILVNQFASIIPRAMWDAKPELIPTPSNLFTQEILGYPAGITISPTILGESFMVGGIGVYCAVMLLFGCVVKSVERLAEGASSLVVRIFYYSNVLLAFQFVREGFSVFAYRLVLHGLLVLVLWKLSSLVAGVVGRSSRLPVKVSSGV